MPWNATARKLTLLSSHVDHSRHWHEQNSPARPLNRKASLIGQSPLHFAFPYSSCLECRYNSWWYSSHPGTLRWKVMCARESEQEYRSLVPGHHLGTVSTWTIYAQTCCMRQISLFLFIHSFIYSEGRNFIWCRKAQLWFSSAVKQPWGQVLFG